MEYDEGTSMLVICIAVGPGEELGALEVLVASRVYLEGPYRIVVVDDTGGLTLWWNLRAYPEVDYIRNWRRRGFAKLLDSLQRAYSHALDHYRFEALVKFDTDALVTGPGLDADILAYLRTHPEVGMLGSRSWREREDETWGALLEKNAVYWGPFIARATQHGYRLGESALGGVYALSRPCLEAMRAAGYLTLRPAGDRIAEDVIFSLLVHAVGYEIHEFAGSGQPLALAYRGLPLLPEEVLSRGKKAIHSLKFSDEELTVRAFFSRARRAAVGRCGAATGSAVRTARRVDRRRAFILWRRRGDAALRAGRPRAARRLFTRCMGLRPASPSLWLRLGVTALPPALGNRLRLARAWLYNVSRQRRRS